VIPEYYNLLPAHKRRLPVITTALIFCQLMLST